MGTMDTPTTSPWLQGLLPLQKHSMGNCEETVVEPIDWDAILEPREPPITPQTVRRYLAQIVHNMNAHFAIHMSGPNIGRITVLGIFQAHMGGMRPGPSYPGRTPQGMLCT